MFLSLQLVILGDSGVGKTCLLLKFRDNAFLAGNFISTVGIDYRVRIRLTVIFFSTRVTGTDNELLRGLSRPAFSFSTCTINVALL